MAKSQIDISNRLALAERQLDRTHQFFPRVDAKASALLAIISGEIAVLTLNLKPTDLAVWYIVIPSVLFLIVVGWVGFHLYKCAFPHLDGGHQSLIYFREIGKRTEANYLKEFEAATEDQLFCDICGQIWRNSEIIAQKFDAVRIATGGTLVSLVLWIIALGLAAATHGQMFV